MADEPVLPKTTSETVPGGGEARSGVQVGAVGLGDLANCLARGMRDWFAAPGISIAIAAIYTAGGWLLAALLVAFEMPYLIYPLAMGFALVAPFVAVAFYDVSRRIADGETLTLSRVAASVNEVRRRDLRWMALITAFAFFIWMDIAAMVTLSFFGATALDMRALLDEIMTTETGLIFLVVGHVVGALIALLVFSISALSFQILYDRDVDVMTAMMTSVRFVWANPFAMVVWCGLIAASIVLSIASALILLPFVLPVLGYTSWHLYKRATETAAAA